MVTGRGKGRRGEGKINPQDERIKEMPREKSNIPDQNGASQGITKKRAKRRN